MVPKAISALMGSKVQLVVTLLVPDLSSPAQLPSDPFIPPQAPPTLQHWKPQAPHPPWPSGHSDYCLTGHVPRTFRTSLFTLARCCQTGLCHSPPHPIWKGGLGQARGCQRCPHPWASSLASAVSQQAYKSTNTAGLEPGLGLRGVELSSQSSQLS